MEERIQAIVTSDNEITAVMNTKQQMQAVVDRGVTVFVPVTSTTNFGIMKVGEGLLVNDGLVSVNPDIIKIEHISLNGTEILPDNNKNISINLDKTSVGLNNVDNTSDLDKPISTDTLQALNGKLDKQQNIIYFGKILYVSETGAISFKDENTDINANAFIEVSLNTTTGVLQFTKANGDIVSIDFPLEELVSDGYYDTTTEEIVLVLANGNEIRFSASKLIDIYQGDDETIEIYVDQETNTNKIRIKASVIQRLVAVENQILQTNNQVVINTNNINALQQTSHIHNNKAILDNIEQPFTTLLKNKIDNIEDNAQINVIEAIKVNGTTLVPTNKSINIVVPTKTSDLTNDSGFITNIVNNLTNYYLKSETYTKTQTDTLLSDKQATIDSSHKLDADLIQDGTTNKTVTATEKNTWNNKQDTLTFDTTPTENSVNPVTSGGLYTKFNLKADKTAAVGSFDLTIDNTTYVITLQAKDVNGNNLGTAKTIDLPLESVVVSGSYDSTTKKVILTLKDGSTVDFSVADLISGLQSEITSTNKLSSDLVDDTNATHKFVTTSEKNTWNGKQNALSTAQLNAVNSGVTSATVSQVTTNTNNISSLQTGKQDKLTAGTNITIDPNTNTISATGGSSITSINGLTGGTLTSPLVIKGGDAATAAKLVLDQTASGQITNNGTQTLFGFTTNNATTLTIGHSSYAMALRGSATRPTYNGNNMALLSDISGGTVNDGALTIQLNGSTVQTFTANQSTNATANIQALPNYSLSIGSTNGGNPRQVLFCSVNYTNFTSESGAFFKLGAMSGHGNGSSYTFVEDIFINVNYTGGVSCNIYKYVQASAGTLDSVARYYGDVFHVIDTTNKIVYFYILMGQYSSAQFTPATKIGAARAVTTANGIIQNTGTPTYYSSGTKVWANGCGGTYVNQVDSVLSSTSENPLQNKVITTALNNKLNITDIDAALSSSSTNPLQNKVINSALSNLSTMIPTQTSQLTNNSGFITTVLTSITGARSGYLKFSNGLLIQWGRTARVTDNNNKIVTFSQSFSAIPSVATSSEYNADDGAWNGAYYVTEGTISTTGFTVHSRGNKNGGRLVTWIAIGYKA